MDARGYDVALTQTFSIVVYIDARGWSDASTQTVWFKLNQSFVIRG